MSVAVEAVAGLTVAELAARHSRFIVEGVLAEEVELGRVRLEDGRYIVNVEHFEPGILDALARLESPLDDESRARLKLDALPSGLLARAFA